MRFASFSYQGRDSFGFTIGDDHLIDLPAAAKAAGLDAHLPDMLALVHAGIDAVPLLKTIVAFAAANPAQAPKVPVKDIVWHPPVRRPGKIVCVAVNNNASDDRKISAPKHPLIFLKPTTCLIGHKQPVEVRPLYRRLHPEPELALVIGQGGRDIDPRSAAEHVFGWTILNDITGNDMRAEDQLHYYALYPSKADPDKVERVEQHLSYTARYKGTDGFGPIGPWLVTRDEIADPHDLNVTCSVGGELLTEDNTRHYTYRYEEIIAYISRYMTLEAGDVISLGTAFRASAKGGRPLHTGDLSRLDGPVEVTISGLGTLSNGVKRIAAGTAPDWRLNRI